MTPGVTAFSPPLTSTVTVPAVNVPITGAAAMLPLTSTVMEPELLPVAVSVTARSPKTTAARPSFAETVMDLPALAKILPVVTAPSAPVALIVTEPVGVVAVLLPITPIPTVPVVPETSSLIESWLLTVPMVAPPFQPVAVKEIACVLAAAPKSPVFNADDEPVPAKVMEPIASILVATPSMVKFLAAVAVMLLTDERFDVAAKVTVSAAVIFKSVARATTIAPVKPPLAFKLTSVASGAVKVPVALVNLATSTFNEVVFDAVTLKALASLVVTVVLSAATVAKETLPVVSLVIVLAPCAPLEVMAKAPAPALLIVRAPPNVSTTKLATSVDLVKDIITSPAELFTASVSKPVSEGW